MKSLAAVSAVAALLAMSGSWAAGGKVEVGAHVGDRPGVTVDTPVQRIETPPVSLPASLPVSADVTAGVGVAVNTPALPVPSLLGDIPGMLPALPVDPAKLVGTVIGLIPAAGGTGGSPNTAAVAGLLNVAAGTSATVVAMVPAGQLPSLTPAALTKLVNDSTAALPVQPGEVLAIVQSKLPASGGTSGSGSPLSALPLGALPSTGSLTSTVLGAIPPEVMGTAASVIRVVPVATVMRAATGTANGVVSMMPVSTTRTVLALPNVVLGLLPSGAGDGSAAQPAIQVLGADVDLALLGMVKVGVKADVKVKTP